MIDLIEVHNFNGLDTLVPHMLEYKQAKKLRYIGATTSVEGQHQQLIDAMKKHKLDFIQVNYSIGDRDVGGRGRAALRNGQWRGGAEQRALRWPRPHAVPQGTRARNCRTFAKDIGVTTWAQFMLKYNLGHPAITAVIPGTTQVDYLLDNQAAGRGAIPDAAMLKRMEEFWDKL